MSASSYTKMIRGDRVRPETIKAYADALHRLIPLENADFALLSKFIGYDYVPPETVVVKGLVDRLMDIVKDVGLPKVVEAVKTIVAVRGSPGLLSDLTAGPEVRVVVGSPTRVEGLIVQTFTHYSPDPDYRKGYSQKRSPKSKPKAHTQTA